MHLDDPFVAEHTRIVTLSDGTRVRLRPVVPGDKEKMEEALQRMSPESRYKRFHRPIHRLSRKEIEYLTEIDYDDHFAWGALAIDHAGEPGVGVARYVRLPDESEVAEAAVAVTDDFHGRGLGTLLLQLLSDTAQEHGIAAFRVYVMPDNRPAVELFRRLGGDLIYEDGVFRLDLALPLDGVLGDTPLYRVLRAAGRGETQFRSSV
jgi:ribosomal protein S18 acetylase RimI-like enzyme